jgi:Retroviral aspartyl protease
MEYDTKYNGAPFPAVWIRILFQHHGNPVAIGPFKAYVDTGADVTCIPESVLPTESKHYQTTIPVRYADGSRRTRRGIIIPEAAVDLQDKAGNWVKGTTHNPLKLILISDAYVGRDVLNRHVTLLDGPRLDLNIT